MNVTFLIGNGFDLNLNLKTSYNDFYKYYTGILSESPIVSSVKENIHDYIGNNNGDWADLELALGKYTERISSITEFETIYLDIINSLTEYIKQEENGLNIKDTNSAKKKLCNDLLYPEQYLLPIDKQKIREYKSQWGNSNPWNTNFISFNYSTTLEAILQYQNNEYVIGSDYGKNVKISNIKHIHGLVNTTLLLGVNDISQIANKIFANNIDALEMLVKPQTNNMLKENIENSCKNILDNSNLICLFGLSIGDTDKIWWEYIGKQIKRDLCIVIFFVKENKTPLSYYKGRIERKYREFLLSKMNLDSDNHENYKEKIFIAHNTDMFNISESLS